VLVPEGVRRYTDGILSKGKSTECFGQAERDCANYASFERSRDDPLSYEAQLGLSWERARMTILSEMNRYGNQACERGAQHPAAE
jgi:hypothetical protein